MSTLNARKKTMGRPRVDSEEVSVRMPRDMLNALDEWRDSQDGRLSRPEAVRRLVSSALASELD